MASFNSKKGLMIINSFVISHLYKYKFYSFSHYTHYGSNKKPKRKDADILKAFYVCRHERKVIGESRDIL